MPSLKFKPVSLKERTGAFSLAAPTFGVGWGGADESQIWSAGREPVLMHDNEKRGPQTPTWTANPFVGATSRQRFPW
jgi:hypothetical protein